MRWLWSTLGPPALPPPASDTTPDIGPRPLNLVPPSTILSFLPYPAVLPADETVSGIVGQLRVECHGRTALHNVSAPWQARQRHSGTAV